MLLDYSVQLQHHARHHLPTFQLIFVHVIESLVFVPVSNILYCLYVIFIYFSNECVSFHFADYDWDLILSVWILWWPATCFSGSHSCMVVWIIYHDQVPFSLYHISSFLRDWNTTHSINLRFKYVTSLLKTSIYLFSDIWH